MIMKKILFVFAVLFFKISFAQEPTNGSFSITHDLSLKRFIENKGQFDGRNGANGAKILYAVDHGGIQIFFTEKGVSYYFFQSQKNYLRKKGEKDVPRLLSNSDYINMQWVNPSTNITLVAEELADDYHTYMVDNGNKTYSNLENVKAFNKLVYKNVFDGIDAEYVFHKIEGLKYSFIVKPGADISKIKMQYGNKENLTLDAEGNLHIETEFGDIIDHAPFSFYQESNKKINSSFQLQSNTVSFLLNNYNTNKPIVIDPWTLTPSAFSNSNKIFEIETDKSNNVYVYGGDSPMRLRKYNAAGVLSWTYNTPWDTATYWVGTLKTDSIGNSYITSGTTGTIRKINTAGGLQWESINQGPFPEIEFWNLTFNCDQSRLFCGGMRSPSGLSPASYRGVMFELSLANGNITAFREVGGNTGGFVPTIKEVRSISYSPNGKLYYITLDSIGSINTALTTVSFQTNSGFNYSYGIPGYGVTNQGTHVIAANEDFIFTNNGNLLQKRNIVTGAVIASVAIPGGIYNTQFGSSTNGNSGIVLDTCGNIYVGSGNSVRKFDNNLNPLAAFSTPAAVYDVAINYNNEVVATGNNFIISNNTLAACPPQRTICLNCLELTPIAPLCPSDPARNLVANNAGGVWSGPGITNASAGTFNPSVAGPGTHVIRYTLTPALVCGSDSLIIIVNNCAALSVCKEANGNFKVNGGFAPYTWQEQDTTLDCSACPLGFCIPPLCPGVNAFTWVTFGNGVSVTPSGEFPLRVLDNSGNFVIINNANSLPNCSVSCPTITTTISSQTNVSCAGGNNGSATLGTTGGNAPYTYLWQPGNLSGATRNNLTAGTYNITTTDNNGCTGTSSVTISAPAALAANATSTNATCTSGGSASVNVSGGTPNYTYTWSNGATTASISNLQAGSYSVTVRDANNCTITASATVSSTGGPIITLDTQNNISCFGNKNGSINISVSGGSTPYIYNWSNNATTEDINNLSPGTFTVTVTDNSNCTNSFSATITEPDSISIVATITNASCGTPDGGIELVVNGGTAPYTFNWSNSSTSQNILNVSAGEYNVTVTDDNGCIKTAQFTIVAPGNLELTLTATDASCVGVNNGSVSSTLIGGVAPFNYTWSNGLTSTAITSVATGIYTLTVTDADQCSVTATATVGTNISLILGTNITGIQCEYDTVGGIKLIINGGTAPYTAVWSNNETGLTITGLSAGNYSTTVTDANGCLVDTTVALTSISGLNITASASNLSCFNTNGTGVVAVNIIGNETPYNILWSTGDTTLTVDKLLPNIYTVTVTDGLGCIDVDTALVTLASIAIEQKIVIPPVCDTTFDGSISIFLENGNDNFSFIWNNGQDSSLVTNINAGFYTTTITDNANNCVLIDTTELRPERICTDTLIIYDVFSPNGDNRNDLWIIDGLDNYLTNELQIFNRWGSLVYKQQPYLNNWNGSSSKNGEPLPSATYYYILKLNDTEGRVFSGHVTIIR